MSRPRAWAGLWTLAICGLLAVTSAAAGSSRPSRPPPVPLRVPFYKQMSLADRKLASHAFDLLWNATEMRDWDEVETRLRRLLASRVVAGPWDVNAVAGLAYCYLFAEYVPRFTGDLTKSFGRDDFERWLLANPDLTRRFVFALTDRDRTARAVEILHELYTDSPKTAVRYPDLAVAMAIVFDDGRGAEQQWKETFRWLTNSHFEHVRKIPHELARYLVETPITQEERGWAYKAFHDESNMDNVYRRVEYDFDSHIGKRPKQITDKDYTLMNLQAYGGTCGDQAYFSSQVGRGAGLPDGADPAHGAGHCGALLVPAIVQGQRRCRLARGGRQRVWLGGRSSHRAQRYGPDDGVSATVDGAGPEPPRTGGRPDAGGPADRGLAPP